MELNWIVIFFIVAISISTITVFCVVFASLNDVVEEEEERPEDDHNDPSKNAIV